MRVAKTRAELAEALTDVPEGGIKFVPTMGALHEGHLSLVRRAREEKEEEDSVVFRQSGADVALTEGFEDEDSTRSTDSAEKQGRATGASLSRKTVVVSIFVNPTQFNDADDLKNYPRTPERDLAMLEAEGVDVVFMPSIGEIYPAPDSRVWDFGELDKIMEGATRPGHFNGVAQVVSRLFELVKPSAAYFGQKDFQQVAIIREMVSQARQAGESWADVEIVECPTVREPDGLALSSRNALLTPEHRAAAPDIYRALKLGAEKAGTMPAAELEKSVIGEVERNGLLKVIYFTVWTGRACIAVRAGNVRLIDNYDYRST